MTVCDSGPLIHLARVGELQLLRRLFGEVIIPNSVYEEVVVEARRLRKPGVAAVEAEVRSGWLRVSKIRTPDIQPVSRLAEEESLTVADAEVLYLAMREEKQLITNDRRLVAVARTLGVEPLWITSLLLLAVRRKIIPRVEAQDLLRRLIRSGLHLRPEVYDEILDGLERL